MLSEGVTLKDLKRHEEAIALAQQALTINPNLAEVWVNKGIALRGLKRFDEAIVHYDKAISLNPSYAEAWFNKGCILHDLKRFDEAIAHYDKAISLNPNYLEACFNKGSLNLFLKQFQAVWEDDDLRLKVDSFVAKGLIDGLPAWNGSSCQHLLILSMHAVGDVIFYASMLKNIKNKVEKITVSVDIRLLPILSRSFPEITFIDSGALLDPGQYDAQILFGSLATILNMHPNMTDRYVPYLIDDEDLTKVIKNKTSPKNKIQCGVAWKSINPAIGKDKSLSLSDLNPILAIKNCEFINLQYGDTQEEIEDLENDYGVQIHTIEGVNLFDNIDGLLSIIKMCDVIVTTSNLTAHLAGALGKDVLLLVPYMIGRIWYWHEEEISSWYPSISLYSQDQSLDWSVAIEGIANRLKNESFK